MGWKNSYKKKLVTAEEVAQIVNSGDIILHGLGLGEPSMAIPTAIAARKDELENVTVGGALQLHPYPWYWNMDDTFTVSTGFASGLLRSKYKEKKADFVPMLATTANPLLLRGYWKADIAILMVTPPNKHGWCNLGVTNFYSKEMIASAKTVVAELNDQMPTVFGDNWVHIDDLDYLVENSSTLPELPPIPCTEVEIAIASNVASLIKDRDTLQLGIGGLPSAILNLIGDREDLGILTEMLPAGLPDLVAKGIVTNKYKPVHKGVSIGTFVVGDKKMYEFIDNNPAVEFYPSVYTNGMDLISKHTNIVAINSIVEIDLKGQLTAESVGTRHLSGSGGQFDFLMGSFWAENGRGISVLPSTRTTAAGLVSTIAPTLQTGATVSAHPYYTQWVATEWGIVDLTGQSYRRRAELLISIAHPDFRAELRQAMKDIYYCL